MPKNYGQNEKQTSKQTTINTTGRMFKNDNGVKSKQLCKYAGVNTEDVGNAVLKRKNLVE